jgi:dTDP-4-dehydrorhamnose reductase
MALSKDHTILVTGAKGQVGFELCKLLSRHAKVVGVDLEDCNLTDTSAIERLMQRINPTVVINPAAYTAVDKAEQDVGIAEALNVVAPAVFAREAKKREALFVHYSTDYVFDGTKSSPWEESDATNPVSVYGRTKRDGENAVLAENGASLIFRLEWVYGVRGVNFLLRILQLAQEREELKIVNDQFGAPTWSRAIAQGTVDVVLQSFLNPYEFGLQHAGIYHMASQGRTSWFDFAKKFLELDPQRSSQTLKSLQPIPSSAYPTPAKRPANSVLNCEKLQKAFGVSLSHWEQQLAAVMEEYSAERPFCEP